MNSDLRQKYREEIERLLCDLGRGVPRTFSENTELCHDLGIDGDDAYEFLLAFKDRFNVDLQTMDYDRHFGPEGSNPFVFLYLLFSRRKLIPVKIGDLIDAAIAGRWLMTYDTKK